MTSPEQPPALFDCAAEPHSDNHRHNHIEHTHQNSDCGHEHDTHNSKVVTSRLIGSTALVNFFNGLVSIPAGAAKTIATTIEGMHNIGDSISYAAKWLVSKLTQTDTSGRLPMTEKLRQKAARHLPLIQRLGYAAISVPAGFGALKSGVDFTPLSDVAQDSSLPLAVKEALEPHKQINAAAIAASGLSLAWNGVVHATIWRRRLPHYKLNANETHFKEHLRYDTAGAVAAFGGALLQGGAWQVQSATAMMLGLYGAWQFRPKKKALEHHHGQGHLTTLAQKAFARAVVYGAPLAYKAQGWRERLSSSPESRHPRLRKLALGGLAVAGVAAGAVIWRTNQGTIDPGVTTEHAGGLADATPRPEVVPDVPIPEVDSPAPPVPETVSFSPEARTITPSEGWNLTYEQLGIDAQHWPELLDKTGRSLSEMEFSDGTSMAYYQELDTPAGGEWRMNMSPDGKMPDSVLEYLSNEAKLLAAS